MTPLKSFTSALRTLGASLKGRAAKLAMKVKRSVVAERVRAVAATACSVYTRVAVCVDNVVSCVCVPLFMGLSGGTSLCFSPIVRVVQLYTILFRVGSFVVFGVADVYGYLMYCLGRRAIDAGAWHLGVKIAWWWKFGPAYVFSSATIVFGVMFFGAGWMSLWLSSTIWLFVSLLSRQAAPRQLWTIFVRLFFINLCGSWMANYVYDMFRPSWQCWCCGLVHENAAWYTPVCDSRGEWCCHWVACQLHRPADAWYLVWARAGASRAQDIWGAAGRWWSGVSLPASLRSWWVSASSEREPLPARVRGAGQNARMRAREVGRRAAEKVKTIYLRSRRRGGDEPPPDDDAIEVEHVMFSSSRMQGFTTMAPPDILPSGYAQQSRGAKFADLLGSMTAGVATSVAWRKSVDVVVTGARQMLGADDREAATLAAALLAVDSKSVRGLTDQAVSLVVDCWGARSLSPVWDPAPLDLATATAGVVAHARGLHVGGDGALETLTRTYSAMCDAMRAERRRGVDIPPAVVTAFYNADSLYRMSMASRAARRTGFKPLIINLIGPPGTGKSSLMQRVFALCVDEVCGRDANIDINQVIDRISMEDKFDSTTTPLTIIGSLDDPVVMRGQTGKEDMENVVKMMWSCATGDQRMAVKAAVEEKGVTLTNYVLIGWASNQLFSGCTPGDLADPDAFARRVQVLQLDWVDPNVPHIIDETLYDEAPTFDELMRGRKLTHGVSRVVDGVFKFEPVGVPLVEAREIKAYLTGYISKQMSRLSHLAVDKNMICRACWSAPCCAECGKNDVRGCGRVERVPVVHPVSGVATARDGAAELVVSAVQEIVQDSADEPQAPLWRAVVLVACVCFLWYLFGSWLIVLYCVFELACRYRPTSRVVEPVSSWSTCALWDLAVWVASLSPTLGLLLVSWARWRARAGATWSQYYANARAFRLPRWAALSLVACAVAAWLYRARARRGTSVEFVAKLDVSAVETLEAQLDELGPRAEVMGGKVCEIDELKTLDEVDFAELGEAVDVVLHTRVRPRVVDPVVLGPRARTATFAQLMGSIDQRCFVIAAQASGSRETQFGVASLWNVGVIVTALHVIPKAEEWSLTYVFQGERVERVFTGDVYAAVCGASWVREGDVVFLRVPMLKSALRVDGFTADFKSSDLTGLTAHVVLGRSKRIEAGSVVQCKGAGTEGMFVVEGFKVEQGMSGSPVWVELGGHPVFVGVVSASAPPEEPSSIVVVSQITTAMAARLTGLWGPVVRSVCGPAVPECWRVSVEVHDKSVPMFEGTRGQLVGAVDNIPRQRIAWEPFPGRPADAPSLWAARDTAKLVYDEGGRRTGCAVVGQAGGRDVAWYDGYCATRAALGKVQRVAAWHPRLQAETVKLTCGFLQATSDLVGWTAPLSFHEALNGVPGRISAINLKSGAGPSWPGKTSAYVTRDAGGCLTATPAFKQASDTVFDEWRGGVTQDFVGKVSVKAETRKLSKDVARNIFVFDAPTNISLKRVFGRLFAALGCDGYKNGLLFMCNAVSTDFSHYLRGLHADDVDVWDLDKAAMDWSYNSAVWSLVTDLLCELARRDSGQRDVLRVEAALSTLQVGLLLVGRYLYYVRIGLGSGWWVTTLVNSLVELTLLVGTLVLTSQEAGYRLSVDVLRQVLRPAVVGDDDCSQVSRKFAQSIKLTPAKYLRTTECLGFVTTAGDKTPLGATCARKAGLRFLKRSLDVVPAGDLRAGELQLSLPVDSILKSLYVRERGPLYLPGAGAATVVNAWRESWLLPPAERAQVQAVVAKVARDFEALHPGVSLQLMGEAEFVAQWGTGEYSTWDSA